MQLWHFPFYCQPASQPSCQLTNPTASWRPLPFCFFYFVKFRNMSLREGCYFSHNFNFIPLFCKKEEPHLQKITPDISFLPKSGTDCVYTISVFPKHPLQWLIHNPFKGWKQHLKYKGGWTQLVLKKLAENLKFSTWKKTLLWGKKQTNKSQPFLHYCL